MNRKEDLAGYSKSARTEGRREVVQAEEQATKTLEKDAVDRPREFETENSSYLDRGSQETSSGETAAREGTHEEGNGILARGRRK